MGGMRLQQGGPDAGSPDWREALQAGIDQFEARRCHERSRCRRSATPIEAPERCASVGHTARVLFVSEKSGTEPARTKKRSRGINFPRAFTKSGE